MLIWSLAALGLPLSMFGYVHHQHQGMGAAAGAVSPDQLAGPRPGPMMMDLAISDAFRKHGENPDSFEGPEVGLPALDHLGSTACWRYPFLYRASGRYGGLTLHRGCFWVKDGHVLREQWD